MKQLYFTLIALAGFSILLRASPDIDPNQDNPASQSTSMGTDIVPARPQPGTLQVTFNVPESSPTTASNSPRRVNTPRDGILFREGESREISQRRQDLFLELVQSLQAAQPDFDFRSMLVESVSLEDFDLTHALLESGLDPNGTNENGEAPIHAAATSGNIGALYALRGRGANLNLLDATGQTAADRARENGDTEMADQITRLADNLRSRQ